MGNSAEGPRDPGYEHLASDVICRSVVLVLPDSDSQLVFEHADKLRRGDAAALELRSPPGFAVVGRGPMPKYFLLSRGKNVGLGVGSADLAVSAKLDSGHLVETGDKRVIDVSSERRSWTAGKHDEGVNIVMHERGSGSKLRGSGDWEMMHNGTIRCKKKPNLVLGVGPNSLILVPAGSPQKCVFTTLETLRKGDGAPLSLSSPPGLAVTTSQSVPFQLDNFNYSPLCIGPASAAMLLRYEKDAFLTPLPERRYVFWVHVEEIRAGSRIGCIAPEGFGDLKAHWKKAVCFTLNMDGTISPKSAPDLCLGMCYVPGSESPAADDNEGGLSD